MFALRKLAIGVSAAMTLAGASVANAAIQSPGAIADSLMVLSNFSFKLGNNAMGVGSEALCNKLPITTVNRQALIDAGAFGGADIATWGGDGYPPTNGGLCRVNNASANPLDFFRTVAGETVVINGITGSETATATTFLNGSNNSVSESSLGTALNAQSTQGDAVFVAGSILDSALVNGALPNQYVGGASISVGNSLLGDANVIMHSQAMLNTGSSRAVADGIQTLNSDFDMQLAGDTRIELTFNADMFNRAALGQPGVTATAETKLVFRVFERLADGSNKLVMQWQAGDTLFNNGMIINSSLGSSPCAFNVAPNLVVSPSCVSYGTGPYGMSQGESLATTGDTQHFNSDGFFEVELMLGQGKYNFQIEGSTRAVAETLRVPEPATLALLGLGLLGFGFGVRRKSS